MTVRLFHFSDEPDIALFRPRPVRVAVERPAGQDWLNGPLVWSIDACHAPLYLFPRECPRIVIWPTAHTRSEDRDAWFGACAARAIAYIERDWLARVESGVVFRYHLPVDSFEAIDDVGMWVSRDTVTPTRVDRLDRLVAELAARDVELRVLDRLTPLKAVWQSSLHASGIRLRNAQDWGKPGWMRAKPGRVVLPT
jgi:hypothetical protein